ncbi:MAG: metal ABC transporter solute-binding protein, Zn/Mn family, partial [Lachnospiraceae bacterium]
GILKGHFWAHEDHEDHEGHETEKDEHIWTSPKNAVKIVNQIAEAVCRADEANCAIYRESADEYIRKLSELDRSGKAPDFCELDLYGVVNDCMENLAISADKRGISLNFSGEHCTIRGNREMIKELTENLVQNAIRYNNPGGTVSVSIINRDRPTLVVKDNGIGIPASEQERVFERFYRVDKSRSKATGGTGLGLAIVKHIVELHDGKIILDSAPGVGTTIQVMF